MKDKLIDTSSLIFTGFLLVFSFIFIYSRSAEFFGSLAAALMIASLGFAAFIIMRIVFLTFKK